MMWNLQIFTSSNTETLYTLTVSALTLLQWEGHFIHRRGIWYLLISSFNHVDSRWIVEDWNMKKNYSVSFVSTNIHKTECHFIYCSSHQNGDFASIRSVVPLRISINWFPQKPPRFESSFIIILIMVGWIEMRLVQMLREYD